jgi:hypothetical protein
MWFTRLSTKQNKQTNKTSDFWRRTLHKRCLHKISLTKSHTTQDTTVQAVRRWVFNPDIPGWNPVEAWLC